MDATRAAVSRRAGALCSPTSRADRRRIGMTIGGPNPRISTATIIKMTFVASRGRGTLLRRARLVEFAEVHPALTVELRELLLLDRIEVARARVDLDAGQQHRQRQVLDVRGLLHDVL